MFDPTAFDNMKVVIEGAFYDLDIIGEIIITDRNDIINMAKMSRHFDLEFKLASGSNDITARVIMESELVHLAAELVPSVNSENLAGCQMKLEFYLKDFESSIDFNEIQANAIEIWGANRKITQTVKYYPLDETKFRHILLQIEFERLISEAQMDDLIELTEVMITTIRRLQSLTEV
jgi:hypothetical protein